MQHNVPDSISPTFASGVIAPQKRALPPFSNDSPRPRKRNTTACRVCRARKTKCDNKKPRCSYCESIGSACDNSAEDGIPLPVGDRAILERIDRLEQTLLQSYQATRFQDHYTAPNTNSHTFYEVAPEITPPRIKSLCYFTVERVLAWPIFQNQYKSCPSLRELMSGINPSSPEYFSPQTTRSGNTTGVELDSCSRLLDSFFTRIHIKNPILDEKEIRGWAREISLNGVGWDIRSCLVLLVCALGAISAPFPSDGSVEPVGTFRDSDDFQLAEAWFAASQKRIGLLLSRGGGILEAQCFFFSGVYLMHCFRPYAAWQLFLQALACCQTFRCFASDTEPSLSMQSFEDDGAGWRSEESVYWTCFKSELELRLDLSLPAFNASDLSYPDFLPSPPLDSLREQDQAWYFYLAEISLRRLTNQILTAVLPYEEPIPHDLTRLAGRMPDFEMQAEEWSKLLPPLIDIRASGQPEDVLRFILRGHLMNCYENMYWPFTTTAINHPTARNRAFDVFVERGLQVCVDRIRVNESGFQHRHHGTFFMMRSLTRSSLLLIAAKKSGHLDELLPVEWYDSVSKVIALLDFWRGESGDAENRRDILEGLLRSLEHEQIRS